MPPRHLPPHAIYYGVAPLIALAAIGPVVISSVGVPWLPNFIVVGLAYGTLIQHPVLAAAWCAFGPAPVLWRLFLSLLWTCIVSFGIVLPLLLDEHIRGSDVLIIVPVSIANWFLVQVPIWGVALLFGLRLRHQGTPVAMSQIQREGQFGIRQLMIYTAFVAVLLGLGRLVFPQLLLDDRKNGVWILGLVFATQILTSLPLIFATLLPRLAIPSVLLSLLLLAAGTGVEIWIAGQMPNWNAPEDAWIVAAINTVGALWTLLTAAVVRGAGYHFGAPRVGEQTASESLNLSAS